MACGIAPEIGEGMTDDVGVVGGPHEVSLYFTPVFRRFDGKVQGARLYAALVDALSAKNKCYQGVPMSPAERDDDETQGKMNEIKV